MNKTADYHALAAQARALLSGQRRRISNAANLCALIRQELHAVNWVGFYFREGDTLWLGPFQGKPACVSIPVGQGVCGTAAELGVPQRVADVDAFDGHIVCDADSRSELVIPLIRNGSVFGVLDLDSPEKDRFSREDEEGLARLCRIYERSFD